MNRRTPQKNKNTKQRNKSADKSEHSKLKTRLHPIQRPVLATQIPQERLRTQCATRDATAQLAGVVAVAGTMHLLVEPTLEPREFAAAEVAVEVAQVQAGLLHELRCVEIAE